MTVPPNRLTLPGLSYIERVGALSESHLGLVQAGIDVALGRS